MDGRAGHDGLNHAYGAHLIYTLLEFSSLVYRGPRLAVEVLAPTLLLLALEDQACLGPPGMLFVMGRGEKLLGVGTASLTTSIGSINLDGLPYCMMS